MGLIQRWRGMRRYRCRECRRTFYSQLWPGETASSRRLERLQKRNETAPVSIKLGSNKPGPNKLDSNKGGKMRRHATELALFLCLVAIFYAALKYLAHVP